MCVHEENKRNAKFNTGKMMAKQIYILGYVIAIILILSNVKIVSTNKNNQYATTTATTSTTAAAFEAALDGTDDPAVSSTQQFHTSTSTSTSSTTSTANAYPMSKMVTVQSTVETKSISALHGRATEFMQQSLHNTSSTIDEEPSMQQPHDQKEVHKQVKRPQSDSNSNSSSSNNNNDNINSDNNEQQRQGKYLVQSDAKNPKQLLSTVQPKPNEKWHNHAHVTQPDDDYSATATVKTPTPPSHHDEFMNENKKTPNAIESNTGITMVSPATEEPAAAAAAAIASNEMRNAQLTKHAHPLERINGDSDNNDDSRKTDEITGVPMKTMVRDNVNATSDAVFRVNENNGITKVNKTFSSDSGNFNSDSVMNARRADATPDPDGTFSNEPFNERSRYLETDLDESPETDVNVDDQLDWSSDASFEELTLDEKVDGFGGGGEQSDDEMQARSWLDDESPGVGSKESISLSSTAKTATQNILKISKPNKSKSIKRLAAAPPTPQALLEFRLSKTASVSTAFEEQFINSQSFHFITSLYDQYEWDANELQAVLTEKCANDMDVYLDALVHGKTWAAKGN